MPHRARLLIIAQIDPPHSTIGVKGKIDVAQSRRTISKHWQGHQRVVRGAIAARHLKGDRQIDRAITAQRPGQRGIARPIRRLQQQNVQRHAPRAAPQRGGERAAGADLVVEDDGLAVDAKRLPRLAPGEDLVDAGRRGRRRSGVGETVLGGFGVPTGAEVGERLPVRWSVLGAVGETLQMRDVEGQRQ